MVSEILEDYQRVYGVLRVSIFHCGTHGRRHVWRFLDGTAGSQGLILPSVKTTRSQIECRACTVTMSYPLRLSQPEEYSAEIVPGMSQPTPGCGGTQAQFS